MKQTQELKTLERANRGYTQKQRKSKELEKNKKYSMNIHTRGKEPFSILTSQVCNKNDMKKV